MIAFQTVMGAANLLRFAFEMIAFQTVMGAASLLFQTVIGVAILLKSAFETTAFQTVMEGSQFAQVCLWDCYGGCQVPQVCFSDCYSCGYCGGLCPWLKFVFPVTIAVWYYGNCQSACIWLCHYKYWELPFYHGFILDLVGACASCGTRVRMLCATCGFRSTCIVALL